MREARKKKNRWIRGQGGTALARPVKCREEVRAQKNKMR
jgi:hypothetical protein